MTQEIERQVVDMMPVGYAMLRIIIDDGGSPCDYEYVEANRAFEEATGLVAAEIVGKRVTEVFPNIKSDEFDWLSKYSDVALKGLTLDFEQYSSSLNKWFKVTAFSPKIGYFVTLVSDFTKEKETNRKLSRELGNQKELQSALMRDAIFTTQANLTQNKIIQGLEYYDEFIERINYDYDVWFEFAKSNVQQEYRETYIKSLCRKNLIENYNKGIEPEPFEYRRIGSDSWIRLVLRVFKDVESDDVYVFGYGFDIDKEVCERQALILSEEKICKLQDSNTKTLQLLEAVKREQTLIQSIFDSIPGYLYVYDESRRLIKWNKKHETMTGFTAEELDDMTLEKWFDQEDILKINAAVNDVFEKGYVEAEASLILKNGEKMMTRCSGAPFILDNHKYFTGIGLDITEQWQLEKKLEENRLLMESIINSTTDAIYVKNLEGQYLLFNNAAETITGKIASDVLGKDDRYLFTENEALVIMEGDKKVIENKKIITYEEIVTDSLGKTRTFSSTKGPIYNKDKKIIGLYGVARDITDRKKAEENLIYLNYHDHLTDLYNRRFFEEELKRLDKDCNLPISIIMCDINGLKLVNDSFGHYSGDALLKKAAETIKKACREEDVIARIGGDEFVVILPKTDSDNTQQVSNRIKDLASKEKVANIELSISYGHDTKTLNTQSIVEIIANAENNMYRHKLSERSSMRSKTIDLIMNALFEKSNREAIHSNRVSSLCKAIGSKMNFDKESVNQIGIAGLIHDIGKIGIDEKILNKPGSLTADEKVEIERHPEIGWRLLSSTNEFSVLAQFVLSHHEKWDGSGYPHGIKGKEIPLESRIIAVADAYDAMTSERSYRKALCKDAATKELTRCSGTQFDPEIVDVFVNQVLLDNSDFGCLM